MNVDYMISNKSYFQKLLPQRLSYRAEFAGRRPEGYGRWGADQLWESVNHRLNSRMMVYFHQVVKVPKRSVGYRVHIQLRQTRCCDTFTGPADVSRNRPGLYVEICNIRNIRKGIEAETLALTPGPHRLILQVFSLSELLAL